MVEVVASKIAVAVRDKPLLKDASVTIGTGELVAVLGPNGAGKTTLLRSLLGLQRLSSGTVLLDGVSVLAISPDKRARKVSYLPQRRPLAWPNTVKDIVALGRFAHGAALGRLRDSDRQVVEAALVDCDLEAFADRTVDSLSGGELARVHFARAVAADAPILFADEPVAELDPKHQMKIAELLRAYVSQGRGVLVVLHDVSLAARYADRILWMRDGAIVSDGSPVVTLTAERMAEVFGVRASVEVSGNACDVHILGAL